MTASITCTKGPLGLHRQKTLIHLYLVPHKVWVFTGLRSKKLSGWHLLNSLLCYMQTVATDSAADICSTQVRRHSEEWAEDSDLLCSQRGDKPVKWDERAGEWTQQLHVLSVSRQSLCQGFSPHRPLPLYCIPQNASEKHFSHHLPHTSSVRKLTRVSSATSKVTTSFVAGIGKPENMIFIH